MISVKDTHRDLLRALLGIAIRQRRVALAQAHWRRALNQSMRIESDRLGGPGMTPPGLLVKHLGDTQRKTALDQAMLDLLLERVRIPHRRMIKVIRSSIVRATVRPR